MADLLAPHCECVTSGFIPKIAPFQEVGLLIPSLGHNIGEVMSSAQLLDRLTRGSEHPPAPVSNTQGQYLAE